LESERLIKEIESHLKEHHYKKVISIIKKNNMHTDNIWLNLYLEHILHTSLFKLKMITPEDCITKLKNILNFSNQTTIQFRFLNIKIYNTIANIYSETGESLKSLYYYNKILKEHMHKNYTNHKVYETLITVLFNKC